MKGSCQCQYALVPESLEKVFDSDFLVFLPSFLPYFFPFLPFFLPFPFEEVACHQEAKTLLTFPAPVPFSVFLP